MSNIVFLKFPEPIPEPETKDIADILQDSGLLDIVSELETKLGLMLVYMTELQDIADAAIERENVSST